MLSHSFYAPSSFLLRTLIFNVVFGTANPPIHFVSGLAGKYSISYRCSMSAIMSLISCTAKKRPGQESLPWPVITSC